MQSAVATAISRSDVVHVTISAVFRWAADLWCLAMKVLSHWDIVFVASSAAFPSVGQVRRLAGRWNPL
jgi:hypothetical protein